MKINIYTMTHKKFTPPPDTMYIPLQVGRAAHDALGYLGDDTGDNISEQNCYYAELTGVYWVWKNVSDADVVGICHYRRYLLNEQEELFSKVEIEALLQQYDILTSKKLTLNFSYAYGFQENHALEDLDAACRVISTLYPDFYPLFARRLQEKHTYFGNIMICRKPLFDEYCSFLFPIFEQMHPLLHLDTYDDYHKRLYGFLSEFLLMVWCEYKHLKVKECKVGLVGEKKETTEVVHRLWNLLHQQQIAEAKNYFLQMREKRPDILMEASDIHGHLHLCLQAISTCEYEQAYLGHIVLPLHRYGMDLMNYLQECNTAILCFGAGQQEPCHIATLKDPALSDYAIAIAIRLYCPDPEEQKRVSEAISKQCQRVLPF